MVEENPTPYVVSADVYGLMRQWSDKRGYTIPPKDFFEEVSSNLKSKLNNYFPDRVEIVSEDELREGIIDLISCCKYPVISLDRAYVDLSGKNSYIDMTRAVDKNFKGIDGLYARPGKLPVSQQLEALKTVNESPIALVDDVIFSGEGVVGLSKKLKAINRPVKQIIAGIAIAEGVEKIESEGIEVLCARYYEEVIDEICERDFFACVPMSGRTVDYGDGKEWSAPYFKPFGVPKEWASIPDEAIKDFSEFCLLNSIQLWRETENLSKRNIGTVGSYGVPRKIRGLRTDTSVTRALIDLRIRAYELKGKTVVKV